MDADGSTTRKYCPRPKHPSDLIPKRDKSARSKRNGGVRACDGERGLLRWKWKEKSTVEVCDGDGHVIRLATPPLFPKGTIKPSEKKKANCKRSSPSLKTLSAGDGEGVLLSRKGKDVSTVECRDSEGNVIRIRLPTPPLFPKGTVKPSEKKKAICKRSSPSLKTSRACDGDGIPLRRKGEDKLAAECPLFTKGTHKPLENKKAKHRLDRKRNVEFSLKQKVKAKTKKTFRPMKTIRDAVREEWAENKIENMRVRHLKEIDENLAA